MSQETIIETETAEEFEHIRPYPPHFYPYGHGHQGPHWPYQGHSYGQHYYHYPYQPHTYYFYPYRHHYPHHHHHMHGHHFYNHARWVQDPWTGEWYVD